MENEQNTSGTPATAAPAAVTSAMTRMSNVFMAPAELYSEVASAPPQTSSWLLPFMVLILIAVVSTFAVYNNPTLRQQIYTMQEAGMKKAVADGKMTQEQMERGSDQMENSGPVMFILIGSVIQLVAICAIFFLGALLLWLIVKLGLKSSVSYSKILETLGLSEWIGVLGAIITIILMNVMNSMTATPGGALILGEAFDPLNKGHKLLAALNVFTLWQVAVSGIGVSKITGKSIGTGMIVAYGAWAFWVIVTTLVF